MKNKTLSLKVRSQPNQSSFQNPGGQISELEQLKLEMVKELRDVREDLKKMNQSNMDCISELKAMNTQLMANSISNISSNTTPALESK